MRAAWRRCHGDAIRALDIYHAEIAVKGLIGGSVRVSKSFSTSTRKTETDGTERARERSRAREWAADDQRSYRYKYGGRYRKTPPVKPTKREKSWQSSDPHEDLCRIKWEPDPHVLPHNWFRGHIPDMIKCKMFELWQEDPEKNSAMALGKQFGLKHLEVQAILTMKQNAKEKTKTIEGYEIYPEIEELMAERKEAFIEELCVVYGQDVPFLYSHCPDIDKNDPATWENPREFKKATLAEHDKNTKFDRPPLQSLEEVAENLNYKRTNKALYAKLRDEQAAELTKKLADKPAMPKKRWAYAMKDTSSRTSSKAPIVIRGSDGKMRGASVSEERTLSYADENLFRRDVRRWTGLREME